LNKDFTKIYKNCVKKFTPGALAAAGPRATCTSMRLPGALFLTAFLYYRAEFLMLF
jgi:hypothetical protein